MEDESKRDESSIVIEELRKSWYMSKVNSNQELEDRLDEFFEMSQNRRIPPTVEEMAMYCGYTSSALHKWKNGQERPFSDITRSGLDTVGIVKKAYEMIAAYDAIMVGKGKMNPVGYIWLSKQHFDYKDVKEVVVSNDQPIRQALTADEIAANLPERTVIALDSNGEQLGEIVQDDSCQ